MNNSDVFALSAANWSEEAFRLMDNGWERCNWSDSPIPVTFHKKVHGKERVLYLVLSINDGNWYPHNIQIPVMPGEA